MYAPSRGRVIIITEESLSRPRSGTHPNHSLLCQFWGHGQASEDVQDVQNLSEETDRALETLYRLVRTW